MARPAFELSVLSFASVRQGEAANHALWAEIGAVERVDALGYKRYWLAEHRLTTGAFGGSAVLLAVLGGVAPRIRIGSAGVLLRYENPYKVAEDFRLLSTLYPGRVDLGVCAGQAPEDVGRALLEERSFDVIPTYAEQVRAVVRFARGECAPSPPPALAKPPPVWVLGGGGPSIEIAGENGCALSLSLFHSHPRRGAVEAIDRYASTFRSSSERAKPEWNVAVAGFCAESEEDAASVLRAHAIPSVRPNVVGTPSQCRAMLDEIVDLYRTREIVFFDIARSRAQGLRSYALMAEACGLAGAPPEVAA